MRRLIATAAAAALALALAGCGSSAASSSAASSEAASSASAASSEAVVSSSASAAAQKTTTVNWTKVASADEAAKGAGFEKFGVMDKVTLDSVEFTNPQFAHAGGAAQALYESGAIALDVRKADGKHDAPLTDRDKTEFAETWSKNYEGLDVSLYGAAKGAATIITWADGTAEYGVTYQGLGGEEVTLDSDEVATIVKGIKEANAATQEAPKQAETPAQFTVPNVVGMDAAAAAAAIEEAGLSPDGGSEGTVVSQTPEAGTVLEQGDTVSIETQVAEPEGCTVPDVVGMEAETAAMTIEDAGLSPDGNTEGTVIDQFPAAGTVLQPGDTVSLSVYPGPIDEVEEGTVVPDIVGMDAEEAAAVLESFGLSPDGGSSGTVIGQSPAAGTTVADGDTVSMETDE